MQNNIWSPDSTGSSLSDVCAFEAFFSFESRKLFRFLSRSTGDCKGLLPPTNNREMKRSTFPFIDPLVNKGHDLNTSFLGGLKAFVYVIKVDGVWRPIKVRPN